MSTNSGGGSGQDHKDDDAFFEGMLWGTVINESRHNSGKTAGGSIFDPIHDKLEDAGKKEEERISRFSSAGQFDDEIRKSVILLIISGIMTAIGAFLLRSVYKDYVPWRIEDLPAYLLFGFGIMLILASACNISDLKKKKKAFLEEKERRDREDTKVKPGDRI